MTVYSLCQFNVPYAHTIWAISDITCLITTHHNYSIQEDENITKYFYLFSLKDASNSDTIQD